MCKNTTNNSVEQQKTLFSLPEPVLGKKIKVDFNAPDMSSNGGLLLARSSKDTLPSKMGRLIPDDSTQCLVRHSYEEMVCQRVNQILCGYEDANDCDRPRCDSALKMSVGRRPSDEDLCSQATMTRLENNVDSKTLYRIGKLFVEQYFKLDYKAQSWKHERRVIAKIEVSAKGTNIRFVVTKNRNNSPETIYKRYCKRGEMELWIKDVKYFKADRMSCNSYRANYFRLFLYAAAFVVANTMKHKLFNGTAIENFTMDSFIKRIMLSAVYVVEKKTFVHVSFTPHHRHLEELTVALERLTA